MEAFDPNFVIRRRKPRGRPIVRGEEGGGVKGKSRNNYLAQTPKNPVGARPGNRNALKHGLCTAAFEGRLRGLRARIAAAIALVDAIT
jgi:hypothetical protein